MKEKNCYISIKQKFVLVMILVVIYIAICLIIQYPWWTALCVRFGTIIGSLIVVGLAILPGIMISMTIIGCCFDKPRRLEIKEELLEDITILIAAYNEQDGIYETLESLNRQRFPKKIIIKVIDNNSKDNTKQEIYRAIKDFPNLQIEYLFEKKQGKFAALNCGLATTNTKYVITIDADTFLYRDSILKIVNQMYYENLNKQIGAIAGTVLVRNSRVNLLTKMQEWEYFLSIATIKRVQGLFQSILVAQGAFSIYNTELIKSLGGWKDSIGEDIVLTWEILSLGYKTYYCDEAIAFTNAPTELKVFARQRARWARGMIEGFKHFSFKSCKNPYAQWFIFADLFLFLIDFSVTFFYIPGLIICLLFGDFIIVGPMTFILYPITLFMFMIMFISEKRRVFDDMGLKVRKHYLEFLIFTLVYSLLMSSICIKGYVQEFLKTKRKWK